MKKTLITSLVFASIVLFTSTPLYAEGKTTKKNFTPSPIQKKAITIPGNKAWTNSGIKLRPQDRVTIKATGDVCFSNGDSDSCVGPNGYQDEHGVYSEGWPGDYLQCDDPLKFDNHAALIANIGSDTFFVGNSATFQGKNGILYLGINDCSFTGPFHNTGQYTVKILVERRWLKGQY